MSDTWKSLPSSKNATSWFDKVHMLEPKFRGRVMYLVKTVDSVYDPTDLLKVMVSPSLLSSGFGWFDVPLVRKYTGF